jgi:hypothetical protein
MGAEAFQGMELGEFFNHGIITSISEMTEARFQAVLFFLWQSVVVVKRVRRVRHNVLTDVGHTFFIGNCQVDSGTTSSVVRRSGRKVTLIRYCSEQVKIIEMCRRAAVT